MILEELFLSFLGTRPLVVQYVDKDCVYLPNAFKELYGLRIVSNVEVIKTVSVDTIKKLYYLSSLEPDKYLFMIFKRDFDGSRNYDSLYYLSYNKEVLKVLADAFGKLNAEFMSGYDIAELLFNVITLTPNYKVKDYERLDIGKRFRKEGPILRDVFYRMVKDIDPEDYVVYAGVGHIGKVPSLERLLELKWSGVLWSVFNFNDPGLALRVKRDRVVKNIKVFDQMLQDYKEGKRQFIRAFACLISKDKEVIGEEVLYSLGWTGVPIENTKSLYVLSTPLLFRETDWEFFFTADEVADMIFYSFGKNTAPKIAEIEGKNRFGTYIAFSFFEENDNPHCMVFAPSGAGKSFNMQNMVSQILRLDVNKLFMGEPQSVRKGVRIRYFDKGFSAELLFKLMKERGIDVGLFSANPDQIVINPCELFGDSSEEYYFSLYTVNSCLNALNVTPLLEFEAVFYMQALKNVYRNPKAWSLLQKQIGFLRSIPAHEGTYERLIAFGYRPEQLIEEIKHEEFSNIKQPLLHDVHRELRNMSESVSLTPEQRQAVKSALTKIDLLLNQPALSSPTQIPIRSHNIVYLDFEHISRSTFFVPIVLTILKRLTMTDKFEKPEDEYAYYIIDEAHNMLREENFRLALEILVREARKYRISLMFLTQSYSDIPPNFIVNANTIIFISPQEESSRRSYFQGFLSHIGGLLEGGPLEHVYFSVPARAFTVKFSKGVFSLLLDVDDTKRMVFDSYRRSLTLPEGKTLRKSMGVGDA